MPETSSEIQSGVKDEVNAVVTELTKLNTILEMKVRSLEKSEVPKKDDTKKPSKLKKNGLKLESGLHRYFKGSIEYQTYQLLLRSIKKQNWRANEYRLDSHWEFLSAIIFDGDFNFRSVLF